MADTGLIPDYGGAKALKPMTQKDIDSMFKIAPEHPEVAESIEENEPPVQEVNYYD